MTSAAPFRLRAGVVQLGSTTVLDGVDFTLETGEFVALLGDNGAGKSTLVKALLCLYPLRGGTLEIFATPADRFRQWYRIGYVPQRFTATTGVPATVAEVVRSGLVSRSGILRRRSAEARERVRRALAEVRLDDRARDPIDILSGGQQQRVLIARALVGDPDVLVLDEPATGVDHQSQATLASTLASLREQGRSVLLVAHGLGAMRDLVTRTVVVDAGRVVHDGPPLAATIHEHDPVLGHAHHHPGEQEHRP